MLEPTPHAGRAEVLRRLEEAIRGVERAGGDRPSGVRTGWPGIDAVLPGGGLAFGSVHEWLGVAPPVSASHPRTPPEWTPPLLLLAHLADCASSGVGAPRRRTVWVGRRVWPSGDALARFGLLERALLLDPPDSSSRVWAIDAALRCSGIVVVADGSGASMAASRRFQLAAESGGALGLLARPPGETKRLSAASTRWLVAARPREGSALAWTVTPVRCRSAPLPEHSWGLEYADDRVVALPADVPDRRGAASAAS